MTTQPSVTPDTEPAREPKSMWSRDFIAVCIGQFFGFSANSLCTPIVPLYMVMQGYSESFMGLTLGAFNVVSFLVRPTFGGLVDAGRPRFAMSIAGLFMTLGPAGYLVQNSVFLFLVRAFHGVGWAGVNTTGSAWVAYLAPTARRAEALGYYTMAQRVGSAWGPVVGLWLVNNVDFPPAFIAASVLGFAVLVTSMVARSGAETAASAAATAEDSHLSWFHRVVEPGAFLGAGLLVLNTIPGQVVSSFMPLYFRELHLGGIEGYFLVLGLMGIVSRGLIGRWADRIGRMRAIGWGFGIQFLGLVSFVLTQNPLLLTIGGAVWIFGSAVSQPSLYALAIDRAPGHRRGRAMATYTMAFQVGSGIGAVTGGVVLEHFGFATLHALTALQALAGLLIVMAGARRWFGGPKQA